MVVADDDDNDAVVVVVVVVVVVDVVDYDARVSFVGCAVAAADTVIDWAVVSAVAWMAVPVRRRRRTI